MVRWVEELGYVQKPMFGFKILELKIFHACQPGQFLKMGGKFFSIRKYNGIRTIWKVDSVHPERFKQEWFRKGPLQGKNILITWGFESQKMDFCQELSWAKISLPRAKCHKMEKLRKIDIDARHKVLAMLNYIVDADIRTRTSVFSRHKYTFAIRIPSTPFFRSRSPRSPCVCESRENFPLGVRLRVNAFSLTVRVLFLLAAWPISSPRPCEHGGVI